MRAVPAVRTVLTPPLGWTYSRTFSILRSLSHWASRGRSCATGSIGGLLFDITICWWRGATACRDCLRRPLYCVVSFYFRIPSNRQRKGRLLTRRIERVPDGADRVNVNLRPTTSAVPQWLTWRKLRDFLLSYHQYRWRAWSLWDLMVLRRSRDSHWKPKATRYNLSPIKPLLDICTSS